MTNSTMATTSSKGRMHRRYGHARLEPAHFQFAGALLAAVVGVRDEGGYRAAFGCVLQLRPDLGRSNLKTTISTLFLAFLIAARIGPTPSSG